MLYLHRSFLKLAPNSLKQGFRLGGLTTDVTLEDKETSENKRRGRKHCIVVDICPSQLSSLPLHTPPPFTFFFF